MPRFKSKSKFKPDEVVVAYTTFATDDYVIKRGTRLRGSHPAVLRNPQWFVADGTPTNEMPGIFTGVEVPQPEPKFYKPAPTIPDEEAVVATVAFSVSIDGVRHNVLDGQRLHRDHPIVKKEPQYFQTLPLPVVA